MRKALPGYSGGKLAGRSTKEGGREEENAEIIAERDKSEMNLFKKSGIEKKARVQVDAKPTAQRTVGQSVKQNWDCLEIEHEEEEENEDWQEGDQMEMQWVEDEQLGGTKKSGRRFLAGRSLAKKIPELVVHERMSQREKAKGEE